MTQPDDGYYWDAEDEAWLHENASRVTTREAGVHFGCLPHVVRRKAARMGLTFKGDPTATNLRPTFKAGDHCGAWTKERFERAKKLWLEGFSAGEIAKDLNCGLSRNAVIGKIHRAGLATAGRERSAAPAPRLAPARLQRPASPPKTKPPAAPKARAPRPAPVRPAPEPIIVPEPVHAPRTADLIPLEALNSRTCKWPIGHVGDALFGFCGCSKERDAAYCGEHARVAYMVQSPEKKRAAKKLYAYLATRAA